MFKHKGCEGFLHRFYLKFNPRQPFDNLTVSDDNGYECLKCGNIYEVYQFEDISE